MPGETINGCAFADRCALVDEKCRTTPPDLLPTPSGENVRCFKSDMIADMPALNPNAGQRDSARPDADSAALGLESLAISYEKKDWLSLLLRPGAIPPLTEPDNATFTIGTSVGTISFSVKNLLVERVAVSLILLFFFSLSIIDILASSEIYECNVVDFFTFIEVVLYPIIAIDVKNFLK